MLKSRGLVAVGAPYNEGGQWFLPVAKADILKEIDDYIQSAKDPFEQANRILDWSSFIVRLLGLSEAERKDFEECKAISQLPIDNLFQSNKAAAYYRHTDWIKYLYGDVDEKPTDQTPDK